MHRNRLSRWTAVIALGLLLFSRTSFAQDGPLDTNAQHAFHTYWYEATIKLDRQHDSLAGVVVAHCYVTAAVDRVLQHAKYLSIDSVFVNDEPATYYWQDTINGEYVVKPAHVVPSPSWFDIRTYYHGPGRPEQYGTMAWGGVTDQDSMMFAMGVGFNAHYTGCTRHWLPCYDLPDDKPDSVDLTFLSTTGDVTASNGLLVSNTVSNGVRTMHWHIGHPIATYLITFATGPYTLQHIQNGLNIPFDVYTLKRDSAATATQMNYRVRQALVFFDSLFAPYPFEKVGYVVTPIGSMEHQTMISLGNQILDTNRTDAVHELAHQWWGDWVTCQTFDDAWLNEGFARYCEALYEERFVRATKYYSDQSSNVRAEYHTIGKRLYLDTIPLSGAPTATHHNSNYPGTIYSKGAAVLGMLREYLGDSLFFASIRAYGHAHAYSTATSLDLENAFERTSGQKLDWFFHEFVFDIGLPDITVNWSKTASGASLRFTQWQDTLHMHYFGMPVLVRGIGGSQSKNLYVWMDSTKTSSAVADFGFVPDSVTINPLGDLLIRLDKVTMTRSKVNYPSNDNYSLRLYPNPAHRRSVRIEMPLLTTGEHCAVTIYDTGGRIVRRLECDPSGQTLEEEIGLTGIPSGAFTVVVDTRAGLHHSISFTLEP